MEALPSSSVAMAVSPPQLALAAAGRVGRGANGLPVFARVVHEALNRAANSSDGPPAVVPSKGSAAPIVPDKVKKPSQSGKDEAPAQDTSDGTSAVNAALLPSLLLALQVANPNQQGQINVASPRDSAALDSGNQPGTTDAEPVTKSGPPGSAAVSGDPASKENSTSPATAGGVFAEQIQAQLPDVISAPLASPAATASARDAAPETGGAAPNSQTHSDPAIDPSAGGPQAKAPTLLEFQLAPAVGDPLPSLPSPGAQSQHKNAGAQSSASPAGDPLSPLPLQGPQLGRADVHTQSSVPPTSGTPAQARLQFQPSGETQPVGKPALAPLPVLGAEPSAPTDSRPMPRGLPTAIDPANAAAPAHVQAPVQASADSSAGLGGSQDGSASHKEPARPDAAPAGNASFPVSATHDVAGGSEPIAASLPAKQDSAPVPATATAANVVPSPPVATFDRAAGAVATPHPSSPPAASAPLPSPEGTDVAVNHFVSNAKLVEAAGHSEMRIAMETEKLGAVELRAHMVGDEVGAAITVERRDAHAALAVELPALQQALSDKELRIEQVTLSHGSFSSTAGDASGSTKQDEHSAPQAASRPWSMDAGRISSVFGTSQQSGIFDSHGRLSVRA
jgi:flagellar hook-length control protein FliK